MDKFCLLIQKVHYANVIARKRNKTCVYLDKTYKDQGSNLGKCLLTEKLSVHIEEVWGGGRDTIEKGKHDISALLPNGEYLFDSVLR